MNVSYPGTIRDELLIATGNLTVDENGEAANPFIVAEEPGSPPASLSATERASLIAARAVQLSKVFNTCKTENTNQYVYSVQPPTPLELDRGLQNLGLPTRIYRAPFYSKDIDIPENTKEFAGLTYRLKGGEGIATLDEWSIKPSSTSDQTLHQKSHLNPTGIGGWEYASHPPSIKQVRLEMPRIKKEGYFQRRLRSQVKKMNRILIAVRCLIHSADRRTYSGKYIRI